MLEIAENARCYNLNMKFITDSIRALLEPLFKSTGLDLRAARWRLKALNTRGAEVSAILSMDDSPGAPSRRLLDLVPAVLLRARNVSLHLLSERGAPAFVHTWPGEPHRLMHALVEETKPRLVLEIGTYTGLGCLSILPALPSGSRLVTFDLIPWGQFSKTHLKKDDFADGRFEQIVEDLGDRAIAEKHGNLLREADLIIIDAAKDGRLEKNLLANFAAVGLKTGALLVFDDVRFWDMLSIWREIRHPKLDLTSLGHWTGTGLIDWQNPPG